MKILRRPRFGRRGRAITANQVACPVAGHEVDVEQCLACGFLREVSDDPGPAWLRCSPPAVGAAAPDPWHQPPF